MPFYPVAAGGEEKNTNTGHHRPKHSFLGFVLPWAT